jgi:hypothetical protein
MEFLTLFPTRVFLEENREESPIFLPTLGNLVKVEKPHSVIGGGAGPRETPSLS